MLLHQTYKLYCLIEHRHESANSFGQGHICCSFDPFCTWIVLTLFFFLTNYARAKCSTLTLTHLVWKLGLNLESLFVGVSDLDVMNKRYTKFQQYYFVYIDKDVSLHTTKCVKHLNIVAVVGWCGGECVDQSEADVPAHGRQQRPPHHLYGPHRERRRLWRHWRQPR